MKILIFAILASLNVSGNCLKIILDERISTCDGRELNSGEVLYGNAFDLNWTFILEEDETIRMIGGFKFKEPLKSHDYLLLSGEKLMGDGRWVYKGSKTVNDMCFDFFNPSDIFHRYFQNMKRCPLQPGVSKFDK